MSAPLTIAILGATGTLGPSLLQAIADHPKVLDARIRILTRPTSAEKAHTLAGRYPTLYLTVHAVDYSGAEAETALRAVDVVLSAVGDDSGMRFAHAAKAAGVKLFVPSEFGAPTHSMALNSESYIVGKRYHHDFLRKLELPYMLVYAGMFPEIEPTPSAPAPLPQLSPEDPIPLGQPPFETSRYHVAAYIVQLLLDRGVEAVAGGIYVIRGLRRDRGAVSAETGKTEWILDV
ncbi:hypothetical protein B0H14DRAFT_3551821 [Mycena olivaceomarginata]|nr:hypothetical protein B0H14DRAFT_3551821 [Mycena olivaceomarginata]